MPLLRRTILETVSTSVLISNIEEVTAKDISPRGKSTIGAHIEPDKTVSYTELNRKEQRIIREAITRRVSVVWEGIRNIQFADAVEWDGSTYVLERRFKSSPLHEVDAIRMTQDNPGQGMTNRDFSTLPEPARQTVKKAISEGSHRELAPAKGPIMDIDVVNYRGDLYEIETLYGTTETGWIRAVTQEEGGE